MIMGTITKYYSDTLLAKKAKKENISSSQFAKELSMNPWAAEKRIKSAALLSEEYIKTAIKECAECDKRLKSFSSDQYAHIELLLEKLIKKR